MSESRLLRPTFPAFQGLPLAVQALIVHFVAWCAILLGGILIARTSPEAGLMTLSNPLLVASLGEGFLAALLSRLSGMPSWWQIINGLFFPAAVAMTQFDIPSSWYLIAFLVLLLTSFGAIITRVPLYLSSNQAHREVAQRLADMKNPRVIDLGCGLGGLLAHLAKAHPGSHLHGADAAPFPWLFSKMRLGRHARIRLGSLWDENLANYDVVYAYLSPAPMPRLWEKVQQEMRPGSLFISNTFAVPGVNPDETVELHDLSHARLLLWRIR